MILNSTITGQGQPILILHGFLGMSDNWKAIVNQLDKSYEVHAIDMRNHGRSFHSDQFSYGLMTQDLVCYCQHYQLKESIVLGHSMGGKTAMQFACEQPNLVKTLVVADIGPKYYPLHHQQILAGLQAIDFSIQPARSDVESVLSLYVDDIGVRQFLLKNLYWKTPGQLAFRFNLESLVKNIEEVGKTLPEHYCFKERTLFLRGANSNYILDEDWARILIQFPNAKLETILHAGHWLHAEQPHFFLEKLNHFLIDN